MTSTNVLLPIMTVSQINNLVVQFFNIASIAVALFAGGSIAIANNIWPTITNIFWSTEFIIAMTLGVGILSLYLFYELSNNVLERIQWRLKTLQEDNQCLSKEKSELYSILLEIDSLNLGTKPIKEMTNLETAGLQSKLYKIKLFLEKIKNNKHEVNNLTIDIRLAQSVNCIE